MFQGLASFLEAHIGYAVLLALGLVGLAFFWRWLNRPGREEVEHQKRFEELKERSRDKYKGLRPLK